MLKKETKSTKKTQIKREWHLIDVKDEVLGRQAVKIARLIIGKGKSYYVSYMDCGDYVVVVNGAEIGLTGRKEKGKKYYRHSGYPGGFKSETVEELRERKPEEILKKAVWGMLPKNKLRAKMIKRLIVFKGSEHSYQDKFKKD